MIQKSTQTCAIDENEISATTRSQLARLALTQLKPGKAVHPGLARSLAKTALPTVTNC
jgi:hypothetical protein